MNAIPERPQPMKSRKSNSTRSNSPRLTFEGKIHRAQEQVARIRQTRPSQNDVMAIMELTARGIPAAAIDPRENVFPFDAWLAFGRHVRKGEKAIAVTVWTPVTTKDANGATVPVTRETRDGGERTALRPVTAYLFHVSQTDPFAFAHANFWTLPESCIRALILCGNVAVAVPQPSAAVTVAA